jgi:DNA-binding FadR family transcriptional regulator
MSNVSGDTDSTLAGFVQLGRAPKASELVAQQLRRHIVTGGVGDGELLPPTKDLLERFGVSRPVLQEAFRVLENEGLITVTRGSRSGARAHLPRPETAARFAALTLQASRTTLGEIYATRLSIEPFAARVLAERRDLRDIAALRNYSAGLKRLYDKEDWPGLAADYARFHYLLIKLTGNQLLTFTATLIATVLIQYQRNFPVSYGSEISAGMTPEESSRGWRSIARLIRLIEAGKADEAEVHWREHLKNANAHWLLGKDEFAVIEMFDPIESISGTPSP